MKPLLLRREILLTRTLIGITLVASLLLARNVFGVLIDHVQAGSTQSALEQSAFIAIVSFLIYGNLVYQIARLGHLRRKQEHRPAEREALERVFETPAAALTVLVPSYREEIRIVRQTLLSAALQEYPNRRVVLLIDDPPDPGNAIDDNALEAVRALPAELEALFEKPAKRFGEELAAFLGREAEAPLDFREEIAKIAELHAEVAAWFEERALDHPASDHTDRLFLDLVLHGPSRAHREISLAFEEMTSTNEPPSAARLRREHQRLAALFRVEISSFERKRYVNLSHEPNKAMNLNSYIGLLGRSFVEASRLDGLHLEPSPRENAHLRIPDADYLLTLDADSLLAPDYALRLAHFMSQPGNERVAVSQTPYSAIPGASSALERIAGATTDMQYIVHQGFTRHAATYWVGANALLRRAALEDIRSVDHERGFEVTRFIQDRTVIEDTESSVDLIERGWTLHNYSERLAYSATPPDFGSLLIQRRRWANGGLIILPKLLRYLARGPWRLGSLVEGFLRGHYLVSIAGVNLGLLCLLTYPFEESAHQLWMPAAALPYYVAYGRDLVQAGYRAGDLLRVYALNILLLPVNLGGVLMSLRQAITGGKSPFARTPKVESRTAAPPIYVFAQYALLAMLAVGLGFDLMRERWLHASFILLNAGMLVYALVRFMGVRNSFEDLRLQLRRSSSVRPAELTDAELTDAELTGAE